MCAPKKWVVTHTHLTFLRTLFGVEWWWWLSLTTLRACLLGANIQARKKEGEGWTTFDFEKKKKKEKEVSFST